MPIVFYTCKYYNMKAEKKEIVKGRDWTFIVYPESAPEDWKEILINTHMRFVVSPLHDKDINPDGTNKKEHYHVLLSSDGPMTYNQVCKIIEPLNSPIPKKVGSSKGLVRYFIHMDNPEKAQYDADDIKAYNGADVFSYFEMTVTEKNTAMKDIIRYIVENKVTNFADFLMVCIENSDDWFDIAINRNTLAINKAIDAVWQKERNLNKHNLKTYYLKK